MKKTERSHQKFHFNIWYLFAEITSVLTEKNVKPKFSSIYYRQMAKDQ